MRRLKIAGLAFYCVFIFLPAVAFSAPVSPWVVPSNIRVVQQDYASGTRVFTSVAAALADIGPTPAGRNIVQVMPGTYTENNLVLPEKVEIIGYGKGITTIVTTGFILNKGNIIENLTVQGTTGNIIDVNPAAEVYLRDIAINVPGSISGTFVEGQSGSTINFVRSSIEVTGSTTDGATYIIKTNPDTVFNLIDSRISLKYNTWQHAYLFGGGGGHHDVNIMGSQIAVDNIGGAAEFFDSLSGDLAITASTVNLKGTSHAEAIYTSPASNIEVNNSKIVIETSSTSQEHNLNFANVWCGSNFYINNSSIITKCTTGQNPNARSIKSDGWGDPQYRAYIEINNSEIVGPIEAANAEVKIGNSKYVGGFNLIQQPLAVYKSLNCYDENMTPYPNN